MNFDTTISEMKESIVHSTQELIKIKSVKAEPLERKPFGQGINNALEYILNLSNNLGFTTKNLDGYIGYAEYGKGERLIGVLVHLDVVPEGEGWSYPPYSGKEAGGKIYGRGAIDDKGPAIAALYALKAIKDSGIGLNSRVRVIFGLDEESGSRCMQYYRDKEEIPTYSFVPDANYPVINAEKGILTFKLEKNLKQSSNGIITSIFGGSRHNIVPDFCEAAIKASPHLAEQIKQKFMDFFNRTQFDMEIDYSSDRLLIKSYGTASHASLPGKGVNAISQLMLFLNELNTTDDLGKFIQFYSGKIGMEYTGASLGCSHSDDLSGNLTLNVGIVNLGKDRIEVTVDIRYPVKYKAEDIISKIKDSVDPFGISITNIQDVKPLFMPPESELVKSLMEVYTDFTGQRTKPISIGGGTYARSVPNAVAFGAIFPGEPELAHQKDEYISIDSLIKNTQIFARAIYKLAQ